MALIRVILHDQHVGKIDLALAVSSLQQFKVLLGASDNFFLSTGSFSWCLATGDIMWSDQVYRIFEFDQAVPVTVELIATRVHPDDMHCCAT